MRRCGRCLNTMSDVEAELVLIRTILGLSGIQDTVSAVRVLHDEGREEFERLRALSSPQPPNVDALARGSKEPSR